MAKKNEDIANELMQRLSGDKTEEELGGIETETDEYVSVSIKELRAAVEKHPDHPCSKVYQRVIDQRPDDHRVNVHKVDVLAIMENRRVERVADGNRRFHKELGEKITGDTPATPVIAAKAPASQPATKPADTAGGDPK